MTDKDLEKRGLTRPRADVLVRSFRDEKKRLTFASTGPMTRLLEVHGYVETVLANTPEEIADLERKRDNLIFQARKELNDDNNWRGCYSLLADASKKDKAAERRERRLTEKALEFVREFIA